MGIPSVQSNFALGLHFLMSNFSAFFSEYYYATCVISNTTVDWNPTPASLWINRGEASEDFADILLKDVDMGCQAFVVADDLAIDFLDHFYDVHDSALQCFALKSVVVFPSTPKPFDYSLVFEHPAVKNIPNFVVINYKDQDTLSLLRSRYPGDGPELVNEFSLKDFALKHHNKPFALKEITDLSGYRLKLALFNYKPYALWKEVEHADSNAVVTASGEPTKFVRVEGTEGLLFIEFCRKLNCTLDLSLDEASEWGEIFENRTGNGVMGAVAERRAVVGVGALYSWHASLTYLAISKPILRSGVTCIVPKAQLATNILVLILPFQLNLWIAVSVAFGTGVLTIKCLSKVTARRSQNDVITFLRIFLMQSINVRRKTAQAKMMYLSYFVLGMMIGNIYSGGLASVLTIPKYAKTIDNVQDLSESGMPWLSTHDAWVFSLQMAEQPTIVKLLTKFQAYSKAKLEELAHSGQVAFTIERLHYGHLGIGEYITEETIDQFQILLDDIYWENCVAWADKTWPLLPMLDDLILRIAQSGIQKYWEQEVLKKYDNTNIQNQIQFSRQHPNPGPVKLELNHMISAFVIWIAGMFFASIIFVAEVIYARR